MEVGEAVLGTPKRRSSREGAGTNRKRDSLLLEQALAAEEMQLRRTPGGGAKAGKSALGAAGASLSVSKGTTTTKKKGGKVPKVVAKGERSRKVRAALGLLRPEGTHFTWSPEDGVPWYGL
mmetsp:Transcript_15245/g.34885  ORF Transcript_15245/g.34885 Transcript_15245/m.34885 type:complete len:121 (-) Transcript_15245:56-418(-)